MTLNPRIFPITRRDFLKQTTLALSAAVLLPEMQAEEAKFVIAETAFGRARGIENNGIKIFKGIPYGANTSGMNRFMPPAEPAKWTGVRDAFQYGHSAPQSDPAALASSSDAL